MKTIVLGEPPAEIVDFLARRRALDQDRSDEVWEGDHHAVPAPDVWHGIVDSNVTERLAPLARAAGLVGSSQFNLGERIRQIRWFVLAGPAYEETGASPLLVVTAAELVAAIDWPQ